MITLTTAPNLIGLTSFATYVLIDENNQLDATKAFVTIFYINLMIPPFVILPNVAISLSTDYFN